MYGQFLRPNASASPVSAAALFASMDACRFVRPSFYTASATEPYFTASPFSKMAL